MTRQPVPGSKLALPLLILLLGFALRLATWGENRFLEDEALYAYWGLRIATGADPMLDLEPVDKPPLFPYTLSATQALFAKSVGQAVLADSATDTPGRQAATPARLSGLLPRENSSVAAMQWIQWYETAARLPSLFASILSIALVFTLSNKLFLDVRVGVIASLLLALSPFDILFASTAFTDPLMTALVLGALLAAVAGRLGVSGLMLGLAVATKQQALLFLPLVVTVGVLNRRRHRGRRARWLLFVASFGAVLGTIVLWDRVRLQRPGFVEQGFISYGGLGPARPAALLERLLAWLELVGDFWVSTGFNLLLVGAFITWAVLSLWSRSRLDRTAAHSHSSPADSDRTAQPAGLSRLDLCLIVFIVSYLALHWLLGFQLWDRYLLGLVPLAAILAARAFIGLGVNIPSLRWQRSYSMALSVILVALLAMPVLRATRNDFALGGDHGAYDGIDDLASFLRTQVEQDAVLYHFWLGYHYRFYLFGAPLRTHWYPTLGDLTQDAYVYRDEPRYIAFPSWKDSAPARKALADAGILLLPVRELTRRDGSVSFRLYRLEGPRR